MSLQATPASKPEAAREDKPYAISHVVEVASQPVAVMHPDRMHAELYDFAHSLYQAISNQDSELGRQAHRLYTEWRPWLTKSDLPSLEAIIGLAFAYEENIRTDVMTAISEGTEKVLAEAFVEPDLLAEYWRERA